MAKKIQLISIVIILLLLGCGPSMNSKANKPVVENLEGRVVYNRINFRIIEENKIWFTNLFHSGMLLPAGNSCTIKDISRRSITFEYDSGNGNKRTYKLTDWLIGKNDGDIELSFHKFFVENRTDVGLDKIRPEFYDGVISGNEELGMNKEEVLICSGYPAYIGRKDPTNNDSREYILEQNDWYYLRSKFDKHLFTFMGGELYKIYD